MPDGKSLSLQYELKVLDELVLEKMNPERNPIDQLDSLMGYLNIAKTQKEIIKKKMVGTAFSFSEERLTTTYIHNHQASLSHLIEVLFKYLDDDVVKKSTEFQLIIDQMISQVVALMRFLADTFKDHFNYDAESTISFKGTASAHFRDQLAKLNSHCTAPPLTVLEIALAPIKEFTSNPLAKPTTFRRLMYFDFLVKAILPLLESGDYDSRKIKIVLIELNFNSNHFFWYVTNEMEQAILPLEVHSEKAEKLSWYLKQINQIQMRTDIIFEPKQESIKEKLTGWLLEEICYLEKSLKHEGADKIGEVDGSNFKFLTNLSVPVYGCFLHLLFECEIYDKHQLAQSLRFFAKHSRTKNVNEIAEESIRQRYYKNEQGTKDKVKALVIKMLNKLNDDF